jgi:hypothetical protein
MSTINQINRDSLSIQSFIFDEEENSDEEESFNQSDDDKAIQTKLVNSKYFHFINYLFYFSEKFFEI